MLKFGLYNEHRGRWASSDVTRFQHHRSPIDPDRMGKAFELITSSDHWRLIAYEEEPTTEGQTEEG